MSNVEVAGIIPARFGSTRFPGKPLHVIAGKPLLQHVWERCKKSRKLDHVIIATDDMRIAEAAFDFGAEVSVTSSSHATGTDRIAEVARRLKSATHFINIQGDEPLIDPRIIDRIAAKLLHGEEMVTAACPFPRNYDPANPNMVKVVLSQSQRALYFSRSLIPADRDGNTNPPYYLHQGIYGYTRNLLLRYVRWQPTVLETAEKLEQLRALEHDVSIAVVLTDSPSVGVDTPEDALRVEALLSRESS
jgi:3-deoxy-manno-octulosonate cytidylyltransferase (CMP-KDO synthetase)